MTISILLPTRDRLVYLRYAVASVLRQEADDWELIISDNCSNEDVEGYVAGLEDPRVRYYRTERLLPVTENWNNALAHSTGEYVLMLGDDDALLPGYFETIRELVAKFSAPDVVYHNALLYTYPAVTPDAPEGYLQPYGYASFLRRAEKAYRLSRATAESVVRDAMRFRLRYGFNMQFATFSRKVATELSNGGAFFRSRFPDYYAMNLLFAAAESIVVEPRPCVVIGVTPKSYGFFHLNGREAEGRAMLEANGEPEPSMHGDQVLLPGTNINTGWFLAMQALSARLGRSHELRPSYRRYRTLQILHTYSAHYVHRTNGRRQLDELNRQLEPVERTVYTAAARIAGGATRVLPAPVRRIFRGALDRTLRQFPPYDPGRDPRRFENMLDVLDQVDPESYPQSFHSRRSRA